MTNKYPICVISKGRWDTQYTANALSGMGARYTIFIEPSEEGKYSKHINKNRLHVLPEDFSKKGQGSIPVRNYVWDMICKSGEDRYWLMDDNIHAFRRMNHNLNVKVYTTAIFRVMEDFTDRYENIAFSGPQHKAFVNQNEKSSPLILNTRIYSCTLIKTDLSYRWRGKYNEDTDLMLRALKDGWTTVLFQAFTMDKEATMTMKGGNTDTIYNTGDNRREFAESLQRQHPDVVEVVKKWGRWHHEVDYTPFKINRLKPKKGIRIEPGNNEYGMVMISRKRAKFIEHRNRRNDRRDL